jgi:hypothetical protein
MRWEVTMVSLTIAILLVSTAPYSTAPDPVAETTTACSVEQDELFPPSTPGSPGPEARPADAGPRSLFLAVESRVQREEASAHALAFVVRAEPWDARSPRARRLEFPGRSWPFALAVTADAATTYWALARGGLERNPLLALGRLDIGMVKIVQFPLLAKAIDAIEARHPRLGRHLRWATLVFHAALAFNNVRLGRAAGELGLGGRRLARP